MKGLIALISALCRDAVQVRGVRIVVCGSDVVTGEANTTCERAALCADTIRVPVKVKDLGL